MKNVIIIASALFIALVVISCNDVRRTPGRDYMPDMRYSRAYETYAPHENLKQHGINYNGVPVPGTIKRGEVFPFPIPKDKDGDSTNYVAAKQIANPLPALNDVQLKEAERYYLINCGICHGQALDGNGPLYNGGAGPFPAAPKNLMTLNMPEGQMFYSVTYGKGQMGPYGQQLNTSQRWMIIHYIKSKQAGANSATPGAAPATATGTAGAAAGATTGATNSAAGNTSGAAQGK